MILPCLPSLVVTMAPKRLYLLFALIILIWGFSWPISKLGVSFMPAIWFAAIRLMIATACIFGFLALRQKLAIPSKRDLPLIISIGLLQMGIFMALTNVGLSYTGVGHAAIIVYSTPLWVTPIAVIFLGEQLRPLKLLGLLLGLTGMFTLFSPWHFDWHNTEVLIGNGLLLLASACWAIAMIISRYSTWHNSALALLPWQLLVGTIPIVGLAVLTQPHPHIQWHLGLVGIMLYIGVLVTALGYWGTLLITKTLPIMTTSLCFLLAPVLGLLSSTWFLGEPLTIELITAMTLIIIGLICIAIANTNYKFKR